MGLRDFFRSEHWEQWRGVLLVCGFFALAGISCGSSVALQGKIRIGRPSEPLRAGIQHVITDERWVSIATIGSLTTGGLCLLSTLLIAFNVRPVLFSRIGLTSAGVFLVLSIAILIKAYLAV